MLLRALRFCWLDSDIAFWLAVNGNLDWAVSRSWLIRKRKRGTVFLKLDFASFYTQWQRGLVEAFADWCSKRYWPDWGNYSAFVLTY